MTQQGLPGEVHTEALEPDVLDALHRVAASKLGQRFYLAGGTGLALQLGHRRSNDLDFFITALQLDRSAIALQMNRLFGSGRLEALLQERHQMDWAVGPKRRNNILAPPNSPPLRGGTG